MPRRTCLRGGVLLPPSSFVMLPMLMLGSRPPTRGGRCPVPARELGEGVLASGERFGSAVVLSERGIDCVDVRGWNSNLQKLAPTRYACSAGKSQVAATPWGAPERLKIVARRRMMQ